jgi:hypothetical protein
MKFKYTGKEERVVPSLSLIVNEGDIIEAPENFSAHNFSAEISTKEKE